MKATSRPAEKKRLNRAFKEKKDIPFIVIHHNDLVWRRTYDEYDEIRRKQIKEELELCRKYSDFTFGIEQAHVLERYAEQEPEDIPFLKELIQQGRCEVSGAYCIQDLNMVCGESILMCNLYGRKYYTEKWGAPANVASLTDAFGMSAQIPQILSLAGFLYLIPGRLNNRDTKILPFPYDGIFQWVGLDGTSFTVTAREGRFAGHGSPVSNTRVLASKETCVADSLSKTQKDQVNSLVIYTTEEDSLAENLPEIVASLNRNAARKIVFSNAETFFDSAEKDDVPRICGEFNPVFTGCYTTRIRTKQAVRRAENQLFEAEFLDALRNSRAKDYTDAWKQLFLSGFHDAVCGCDTDRANEQVLKKVQFVLKETTSPKFSGKENEFQIAVLNGNRGMQLASAPVPPKDVPYQEDDGKYLFEVAGAYSVLPFRSGKCASKGLKKGAPRFKTKYYSADFSGGIARITNTNGENVFKEDFGELLLRADYGTMWQEEYPGAELWSGRKITDEKLVSCEEGPVAFRVVTEGRIKNIPAKNGNTGNLWPGFVSLSFRKKYIFPKNADYFTLKLTLNWQGCNTKAAIRFPLDIDCHSAHAVYSIPFGIVERKPYFEIPETETDTAEFLHTDFDYVSAKGDWPALNWVDYCDGKKGLAVANNGTPGHQLKSGDIMVSLFRSGTQVLDGGLVPQKGSFDNGKLEYEFAFRSHAPEDLHLAEELGEMLNRPAKAVRKKLPNGTALEFSENNIALSAVRQTGDGILVRAYETLGRQTTASVKGFLIRGMELYITGADGIPVKPADRNALFFRPFEIQTFFLKKQTPETKHSEANPKIRQTVPKGTITTGA